MSRNEGVHKLIHMGRVDGVAEVGGLCITYLELASRRWRRDGRGRRDVCFGRPEREDVPGHLVGQTRDGGEYRVGGFGAPAERERPES